jgi:hypothetical protein
VKLKMIFTCEYDVDPDEQVTDTVKLISQELIGWQGMTKVFGELEDGFGYELEREQE